MPEVSVVIPVFNAEQTLPQCVQSIIDGIYTDYELILVDDGSGDRSWDICRQWENRDTRITAMHQDNRGPSSARNRGIKKSRARWLLFIDADDTVSPSYISDLIKATAFSSKVHMVVSGLQAHRDGRIAENISFPELNCSVNDAETIWQKIKLHKYGFSVGKLYRRDIVAKYSLTFNESVAIGEDCMFMMEYLMACEKSENATVQFIAQTNYDYNIHSCSLSTKHASVKLEKNSYDAYRTTILKLKNVFVLDETTFNVLKSSIIFYADRLLNAINDIPKRKDRMAMLLDVDLKEYKRLKKSVSWKEWLLKQLLVCRFWLFYDLARRGTE